MRIFFIIILILNSVNCFSQDKIKNIFDPNNVNTNSQTINKITKNFDFILYGIINTKNVKKVIIKPKVYTREIKKKMDKHKYIILKIGEEFQNIKLISIDNDTAKFKKGDKIISMRVFQNLKNDRIKISNIATPRIINNPPANAVSNRNISKQVHRNSPRQANIRNKIKKKGNFFVIPNKKGKKSNKSHPVNPFFELLKKAKKQNSNHTPPVPNPFLELLKRSRRK